MPLPPSSVNPRHLSELLAVHFTSAQLDALRNSLPSDGTASVIVTSGGKAQYLQLGREDLPPPPPPPPPVEPIVAPPPPPTALERARAVCIVYLASHRVAWGVAAAATCAMLSVAALSTSYRTTVGEIDRLTAQKPDASPDLTSPLQRTAALVERLRAKQTLLDQQERILALREEAVRVHLEATRHLAGENMNRMRQAFTKLGIPQPSDRDASTRSAPAGGAESRLSQLDATLMTLLDAQLQSMLLDDTRLRGMIELLPRSHPLRKSRVTSHFGYRRHPLTGRFDLHQGLDLVSDSDPRVFGAGPGKVTFAGDSGGYGNMVVVEHDGGIETRYAHLRRITVKEGQMVSTSTQLGVMGNTGFSSGPHLHFEVRLNGRALDPLPFLQKLPPTS